MISRISRIILSDTFLLKLNPGLMQTGGGFILPDYFYHTKDEIIRLHSYLVHRENWTLRLVKEEEEEKGCCNIAKGFFCPFSLSLTATCLKALSMAFRGKLPFFKENRNFQLRQDLQYRLSEAGTFWVGLEGWSCFWNKPSFRGAVWKEV